MAKRLTAILLITVLLVSCLSTALAATRLKRGSRGTEVTRLQTRLQELGYYTRSVDGAYGSGTIAAVKAFQAKNGLEADGIAGPLTLAILYGDSAAETEPAANTDSTALGNGARGQKVTALQTALKNLGYYNKKIDGVYGKGTISAVQAFQRAMGLTVTGTADSQTQQLIFSDKAQGQAGSSFKASRLKLKDTGSDVTLLQTMLKYLGFYTSEPGGTYDAATKSAVTAFQKSKKLTADGIAGPVTLTTLQNAYAASQNTNTEAAVPKDAVSILNAIAAESGAACGTVVLTKDGVPFLTWSFGGVDENTCFRIASVTKWVTAIGLMTLYDQGKLDLDRDISRYLPFTVRNPAFPNKAITARMLLSHTSSLSPKADNYHPDWGRISKSYDPLFDESVEPGTMYAYADYNGALFGGLIEAISGEGVQRYLNRTVFEPLGLTAAYTPKLLPAGTATKDLLDPRGKVAISVQTDRNRAFNNSADPKANNGYTVGKLYINAASLTTLAQMMLGGGTWNGVRILSEETVDLMESDQPGLGASRYGLSTVRMNQFPGGTWYGHQGRYSGLSSNVYYQRETGITLALIMNGYDYKLEDNVVMPAVQLMNSIPTLVELLLPEKEN